MSQTPAFSLSPEENGGCLVHFYADGTGRNFGIVGDADIDFYWRWQLDTWLVNGVKLSASGLYTSPGPLGVWELARDVVQQKYLRYVASLILEEAP